MYLLQVYKVAVSHVCWVHLLAANRLMADSGLEPGEGPSGLVAKMPLVNSPMSPPNNVSLSTSGLPPPPSQSPGLLRPHNSTQIGQY